MRRSRVLIVDDNRPSPRHVIFVGQTSTSAPDLRSGLCKLLLANSRAWADGAGLEMCPTNTFPDPGNLSGIDRPADVCFIVEIPAFVPEAEPKSAALEPTPVETPR